MPPTFDGDALTKLAKRTEYETWFLEAVYALVENELFPSWPDGVVYPADKSKGQFFGYLRGNIILGDWRPGFLNAGGPLVFVATFKLLDMLVEWILEENKLLSDFRFQMKLDKLNSSPNFPPLIESRRWLRERLVGLYSTLEPLRGTIIHDKHFTTTDGAIQVASSKKGIKGSPVEISATHLRILARSIVSVLKYVDGTWQLDEFRERTLRHDLDELAALHGLPTLAQKSPFHTCVRVYSTDSNPLLVDLVAIRNDLDKQYMNQDCSFDLRVLMVKDSKVVDAYLFPWSVFANLNADWSQSIDPERYRTAIPEKITPEHLRREQG